MPRHICNRRREGTWTQTRTHAGTRSSFAEGVYWSLERNGPGLPGGQVGSARDNHLLMPQEGDRTRVSPPVTVLKDKAKRRLPVSAGTAEGPYPHHLARQRPGEGNWSPQYTQDRARLSSERDDMQNPLPRDAPKSPRSLPSPRGDPWALQGARAPAWPAR